MDFEIESTGLISSEFLKRNIKTFFTASQFVASRPYSRNKDKSDILAIFKDQCGTCSTKHALLKRLAEENNKSEIKLFLGIFKMNILNTPKVKTALEKYHLQYIPEAHNYLKVKDAILDLTDSNSGTAIFSNDLLMEQEISPSQIMEFKIKMHKEYLKEWLLKNSGLNYSLEEIWGIREECIEALSS